MILSSGIYHLTGSKVRGALPTRKGSRADIELDFVYLNSMKKVEPRVEIIRAGFPFKD